MPVCSYLVHPVKDRMEDMVAELRKLPYSEVAPAENQELAILVTDTENKEAEEQLQSRLKEISEIQCITLTFGDIESDHAKETPHA